MKPAVVRMRCAARSLPAGILAVFSLGMTAALAAQPPPVGGGQPPPKPGAPAVLSHQVTGEPVVDLLRDLSTKAGARWTADAELNERRVHLLVQEVPEARLRTALADIVDGLWKQRDNGDRTLQADPRAAVEAERIVAERRRQLFERLRAQIANPGPDPEAAPGDVGGIIARGNHAAAQLAGLLGDREWQQLAETGQVSLTMQQLGERGPALIGSYVQRLNDFNAQTASPPLDAEQAAQGPFLFRIMPDANGEPYGGLTIMVRARNGGGGMTLDGYPQPHLSGTSTRWSDGRAATGDNGSKEPTATVNFEQPPANWGAALRVLARDLKIGLVSEDYTRRTPGGFFLRGSITGTTPEILDRVCRAFGYQWRRKNGLYEFRSVAWYVDRKQEPPGTLVKAAVVAEAEKRPLTLDWLMRAAPLTVDQQTRLRTYASAGVQAAQQFQPVLLFCGALTPAQRAALESEAGLKPDRLQPRQREALVAAVQPLAAGWSPRDAAQSRVNLKADPRQVRFTFTSPAGAAEATVPLPYAGRYVPGGAVSGAPAGTPRPPGP